MMVKLTVMARSRNRSRTSVVRSRDVRRRIRLSRGLHLNWNRT